MNFFIPTRPFDGTDSCSAFYPTCGQSSNNLSPLQIAYAGKGTIRRESLAPLYHGGRGPDAWMTAIAHAETNVIQNVHFRAQRLRAQVDGKSGDDQFDDQDRILDYLPDRYISSTPYPLTPR